MKIDEITGLKTCSHCKRELDSSNFYKCKSCSDGLEAWCKDCKRESVNSEKGKFFRFQREKRYRQSEKGKLTNKKYESSELGLQAKRRQNKRRYLSGQNALYIRIKRQNDKTFALKENLRNRIYYALKGKNKSDHTLDLLGCTIEEFRQHLENQFVKGMNWDNYGEWHIDHIIPCAVFDLEKEENQYICFNFRNLQPLWAKDNLKKKDKIPDNIEELIEKLRKEIES